MAAEMWERLDALVARAPDRAALRHHGLELFGARAQTRAGLALDPELRAAQRLAALRALGAPQLLARVRRAVDGPLVLMKGPEAALHYPCDDCRTYKDLDILSPDAEGAHAALIAAGFHQTEIGGPDQHLAALQWPGIPLTVEIHRRPHSVAGLRLPGSEELLELTEPSRTGIEGLSAFTPAAHAVLLAIHAWAHGPLQRLGQLVDVAAVLADADRRQAARIADEWGCSRLWETTLRCLQAVLFGDAAPIAQRAMGRHLAAACEPTVLTTYAARMTGPLWALPLTRTWSGVRAECARTALPYEGEPWAAQWSRARRAIGNTFAPLSTYRA